MSLDEDTLQSVANGGMMESDKWAGMIEPLVERLEHIVYNVFPMPRMPPESNPPQQPSNPSSQPHDPNNFSSNKESTFPDLQTSPRPTPAAPPASATPSSTGRVSNSQPQSFTNPTNDTLPTPLFQLLNSIKSTLRSLFALKPPHTIQRLAELILNPNAHYRTLPAYLRAVDRVISVTTSAEVFPLQMQMSANQPNGVTNGGGSFLFDHAPGSDESLGGALLTPIPWLSNETSFEDETGKASNEGINRLSSTIHQQIHEGPQQQQKQSEAEEEQQQQQPPRDVETTTTTTITHETTTLPHHPTTPTAPSVIENEALGGTGSPPPESPDELPHARGPPVVGVEDMGLQDGKDVEMPLSNADGVSSPSSNHDNNQSTAAGDNDEKEKGATAEGKKKDGDGDVSLSGGDNEKESSTEKTQESDKDKQ